MGVVIKSAMRGHRRLTKNFRYYFLNFLSKKTRIKFLRFWVRKQCGRHSIHFSTLRQSIKNVLYLLPEDPVETILQIPTLAALQEYLPCSKSKIFCRNDIADLIQGAPGIPKILSYTPDETLLFSDTAKYWIHTIRQQHFDACFLLDRMSDIRRYFICACADIPLRITYTTGESDSFFNLTVRPQTASRFIAEQNLSMIKCLRSSEKVHPYAWVVEENKKQLAKNLLQNHGLIDTESLIGISVDLDASLVGELVPVLMDRKKKVLFMSNGNPGKQITDWTSRYPDHIFLCPPLSFDEAAGVLSFCEYFISGKEQLLYLSWYVGVPVVSVVKKEDIDQWTKFSPVFQTVSCNGKKTTAAEIIQSLIRIQQWKKTQEKEKPSWK